VRREKVAEEEVVVAEEEVVVVVTVTGMTLDFLSFSHFVASDL